MGVVEFGISIRPATGQRVSGDVAICRDIDGHHIALLADVLGHGEAAHSVAMRIEGIVRAHATADVLALMCSLDEQLQETIGAAIAICMIDLDSGSAEHMGIGNVTTRVLHGGHELVSRDGVVGGRDRSAGGGLVRRLHEGMVRSFELQPDAMLVMHSDGVRSEMARSREPGLASSDTCVVAETAVRCYGRGHDDAACLAVRYCA